MKFLPVFHFLTELHFAKALVGQKLSFGTAFINLLQLVSICPSPVQGWKLEFNMALEKRDYGNKQLFFSFFH